MTNRKQQKIFVIGRNKTGTTSIGQVLISLGYKLGDQSKAELLIEDWAKRDFRRIIWFCHSADAFQDIPFSLDDTYKAVDEAFPDSKFILSIRNNAQEWFQSLTRFHTKLIGKDHLPTANELKRFSYREKGWLWRVQKHVYGVDKRTLYDPEIYMEHYKKHNKQVMEYFQDNLNKLLILNLASPDSSKKLSEFLDVSPADLVIPHLNRSDIED